MKFAIWSEGYLATGMEGIPAPAIKLGDVEADTFKDACVKLCTQPGWQERNGNFDAERLAVWGCQLFDNEAGARKNFG